MPLADSTLRLLALSALSMAPSWAHALCQPMAATGQRETVIANVTLNDTNTLLALDGSRIRSWEAPVDVETGPRATPVIWAERVDWSVYAAEPDARIGPTVLRFERGADGVRHLCGIAEYDARTLNDAQASRQKTLPKPDNETRFQYDDKARLIGVELRSYAASGKPNASLYTCLRYDRNGWLAERSANACSEASQPLARYVHDDSGRLLRTIAYVEKQGDAREVTTFDAQGQPAQRYERQRLDWENEQLTLGLPYRVRPSEFAVLVLPGPNWAAPAMESYHYDWAIVQPQDGDVYAAKRNPAAVLASGNSGNDGRFTLSPAQRQRVWEAAGQTPGSVQWLWAPGQIYTLLQTVPKATWAACTDPENRQPDACESR
ncbi:MAG: hypothetical protein ACN6PB_22315 [Achromobacter kerstersii]|uniref:hypothetical protein n=1 Tax=Achromobacter kerstersii TaxID=1353890 RepID=UPI003D088528